MNIGTNERSIPVEVISFESLHKWMIVEIVEREVVS